MSTSAPRFVRAGGGSCSIPRRKSFICAVARGQPRRKRRNAPTAAVSLPSTKSTILAGFRGFAGTSRCAGDCPITRRAMGEPASDQFSWKCPACDRRVPARIHECRCGFQRLQPDSAPPAESVESRPRRGPSPSLILILGAATALELAFYSLTLGTQPAAAVYNGD